ncbi:putative capsular polysaccharide synthesis family protein [Gracilibacillus kekensis]|uniref:Putative capsular polysaccharide synthesis protein n=1 Tax=Gracilibacillus kekensis TaxID=1027249 RepID=A0A1M7K211_9BACI|nr:putative capsular polysaccharide synthesis family protein [Gracilibacillus kekensis]SHM59244.1 Putative capsular polysaccharide synthesis protein [Gracilibacillus kekensis]
MLNSKTYKNLVLVYQMGKVGSTSIEEGIKELGINVQHIHSLKKPVMIDQFKDLKSLDYYFSKKDKLVYKFKYNFLFKNLLKTFNKRIKIISIVREPIGRNIGMFFQGIHFPIFEINRTYNNRSENAINFSILNQMFLDKFNHRFGVDWFDNEFKQTIGVDVYKYPFNKSKGFEIITTKQYEIMIIKMEKINELEVEINNFLDRDSFKLNKVNSGYNKWYSDLYSRFKSEFNPSEEYINELYDSDYMRHFYTNDEIDNFKNYWLR